MPSSSAKRLACPASRALEKAHPPIRQDSANEGVVAHEVANEFLKALATGGSVNIDALRDKVTPEMLGGAKLYQQTVAQVSDVGLSIEQDLNLDCVHPGMTGRPDCWHFDGAVLSIFEYKFGHTPVDAFENWQLIAYAAGIGELLKIQGHLQNDYPIHFYIIQPRSFLVPGSVSTWRTQCQSLAPYFETLRRGEALARRPNAPARPSSMCHGCSAKLACPALQSEAIEQAEYYTIPVSLEVDTPGALGLELKFLQDAKDIIEARITGLEVEILERLKAGEAIPYFSLETTRGATVWKDDARKELTDWAALYGVTIQKQDLITPIQAKSAGLPDAVVDSYAQKIPGRVKLARVNQTKIKKLFNSY